MILNMMIFLVLVLLSMTVAGLGAECIESERRALLTFKQDLIDENGRLSTWGSEQDKSDCCQWHGVQCKNRTGHVIKLDLAYTSYEITPLRGEISSSLLDLVNLNYLDLSDNDFGGTSIPNFIGSFSKLIYLDLSYANFSGVVPFQLGNLSKLHHLDISFNPFDSNPISDFFGSMTGLRSLVLSTSNFNGAIPYQLGNLSNLQYLDLSNNYGVFVKGGNLEWLTQLSSLKHLDMSFVDFSRANHWVDAIKNLPFLSNLALVNCQLSRVLSPSHSLINSSSSIASLDLSSNNLTSSIYTWLFNLSTSLDYLNLGRNELKGNLTNVFGDLTSLKYLYLFENQLEGEIPKSLGNLCNLRSLDFSSNNLSGNLQDFLSGCAEDSLETLWFSENKFTGSFPSDISRFSSLRVLDFSQNKLYGKLPETIGLLSKLEILIISRNSFEGFISEGHLSNLSKLKRLDLSFNSLAFNLSSQWISPFQLEFLLLRSCKLGPEFPVWIKTMGNFSFLDLSSSGISDSIPMSFWDLSNGLLYLNLSSNNLKGEIPNLSLNFVYFPAIDLSSNSFEGLIPRFLSHTSSLYLSRNEFSGTLSFLNGVGEGLLLSYLDVSLNQISGEIPDCWVYFPLMKILNLSHNKFSGTFPSSVGYLFQLETFVLRNNNFSGEFPLSIRNCTSLRFMDVRGNNLSGNIPAWIGENLSQLYVLILGSNTFYGSIPLHLCHLRNLQFLDLSMNNISGIVPQCFGNFTAMIKKEFPFLLEDQVNNFFSFSDGRLFPSEYVDNALVGLKGEEFEYGINLELLKGIDLSSNKLTGELPEEITGLLGIITLNVSGNMLYGKIPQSIGDLKAIESLDLSRNQFSGEIPTSMSELNFLGYLDLSYNNLSGRIPLGTQLQGFDASTYKGNDGLCGPPLISKCPGDKAAPSQVPPPFDAAIEDEDDEFETWFGIGAAVGFSCAFGGLCGALLLNSRWRNDYFIFLDSLKDSIKENMAELHSKCSFRKKA